MESTKKLCSHIRVRMRELGLAGNALAKEVGVHEHTLSRFLNNKTDIKSGTLIKILNLLDFEIRPPKGTLVGDLDGFKILEMVNSLSPSRREIILDSINRKF